MTEGSYLYFVASPANLKACEGSLGGGPEGDTGKVDGGADVGGGGGPDVGSGGKRRAATLLLDWFAFDFTRVALAIVWSTSFRAVAK